MGRPKYTIKQSDMAAAHQYIQNKLSTVQSWPVFGKEEALEDFFKSPRSAKALNNWCELWLNESQWKKLKNSILAARKRKRDSNGRSPKHIVLNHHAWKILSALAQHKQLTMSEFIIREHEDAWERLPGEMHPDPVPQNPRLVVNDAEIDIK